MNLSAPADARPSYTALAVLVLIAVGLWWANVAMMGMMAMMPASEGPLDWSGGMIIGTSIMWLLMMAAMMLPAMSPVISIYARLSAKEDSGMRLAARVSLFGMGYFALWAVISVALALMQLALRDSLWFTMDGTKATPLVAGALLVLAGGWQLTSVKDFCLEHCRHPLTFLIGHWREGVGGAFPMGLRHGVYCVGCCVALMGLMFVFGAMNLLWMAVIAAYFLAEKVLPAAETWGRWVGVLLIVAGMGVIARALI